MQKGVKLGVTRGHYAVELTRQQAVIYWYLKGLKWTEALRSAGYNESSALHYSKKEFLNSAGVQRYISRIGRKAELRFGESLPEKVINLLTLPCYLDGLEAAKPVKGSQGTVESPDWMTRKQYLDKFVEFFGWIQTKKRSKGAVN